MYDYILSEDAKEDLIRIYQYGVEQFGIAKADLYFNSFFDYFDLISHNPYTHESVDYIRKGYRRCVVGPDSIYFRIVENKVQIMAIIGRQNVDQQL
jgi:toxin ParE1/3/4